MCTASVLCTLYTAVAEAPHGKSIEGLAERVRDIRASMISRQNGTVSLLNR